MKITEIQGIGDTFAKKLVDLGIDTVESLLKEGASPSGRKRIVDESGISPKVVLRCINHADLFRVQGVSGQYAELLEAAGVDTVKELSGRRADNLAQKMAAVNEDKNLVNKVPGENQVRKWIDQAKELPRVITY
jgi:predicted flap endonuclease-1-like 5' DNA nuclease